MSEGIENVTQSTEPLSWSEARCRLRVVLQSYLADPPQTTSSSSGTNPTSSECTNFVSTCISMDLDLYAGSILLSALLLILTCLNFTVKKNGYGASMSDAQVDLRYFKLQIVAAACLFIGSITSLWMVRRRRFLCRNDSDSAKRREILKFLRVLASEEDETATCFASPDNLNDGTNLFCTSQADVYPVFRQDTTINGKGALRWSRIPSLLLVNGDYIALQIGDIAPANCIAIEKPNDSETCLQVRVGDRLSLAYTHQDADDIINNLPKGRTTLQRNSGFLLPLCSNLQIYRVIDTPLEEFLRRHPVATRQSQISRKLKDVRHFLFMFMFPVLILTSLAVFARPSVQLGDLTLVASLPLLAALGILPVVGPFCVIALEVVGTARILATVHPFASRSIRNDVSPSDESRRMLVLRYMFATLLSRLSLWDFFDTISRFFHKISPINISSSKKRLIRIPPASLNVLDVLGHVTAMALIDDELVCEPHSIPQQLLIPTGTGLKLLDICPEYDESTSTDADILSDNLNSRKRGKSFDSDSESDDSKEKLQGSLLRRKILQKKGITRQKERFSITDATPSGTYEVQFEEPTWWQHLPSLKCIGLACLLTDGKPISKEPSGTLNLQTTQQTSDIPTASIAKSSLVELVTNLKSSPQLQSLAECIGFSTSPRAFGSRGDISPFVEVLRIHAISVALFKQRLLLDAHERSSEQSRWWGLIRPDATSVVVKDSRTEACQLLTVGDPEIITNLCNEAWQGEISTILPLAAIDKQTILETTDSWKLGDLDVTAFCYSPVPYNVESWLSQQDSSQLYLLDNCSKKTPLLKDKSVSQEWSLIRNQIFLGVLGSLVVPRREIQKLLDTLSNAGIRFVYFSPRNMRRQKELAIQMGIDVAWNCAISLRPLQSGEEDPHRMVSTYADWVKKARLPHGVEDVRKHLKEVDNVPLLVSLFTDVTKQTTQEMVEIFQEYSDTVISIGLSHLPTNDGIFSTSDIAVGIDVLFEYYLQTSVVPGKMNSANVLPSEIEFVSSIAAHSCAFRFRGASSVANIAAIVETSRESLEAAVAAGTFFITGCISFSMYVLFSACFPLAIKTTIPLLDAVLFLQFVLPCVALSIALSDGDKGIMKRVPPKNDQSIVFDSKEGYVLYSRTVLKALLPALLPQALNPMVYGHLLLELEPDLVLSLCPGASGWLDVVRCDALENYSGIVRTSAGAWVFVLFVLCILGTSSGYLHLFHPIWEVLPWQSNRVWVVSIVSSVLVVLLFVSLFYNGQAAVSALPVYYYVVALIIPILCVFWVEVWKLSEIKLENRSEKVRRLRFETRLGAWSPR